MKNEIIFIPSKAFFTRKSNKITPNKDFYSKVCLDCGRKFNIRSKKINLCIACLNDKKGKYSFNFKRIRKLILIRDKFQCQCCRSKERLKIHHISGNKGDNRLNNLITLCVQCHASLHRKYGEDLHKYQNIRELFPKEIERGLYGVRLRYLN